ncbi:MAG TPA: endolytic transglycosylase MltG [Candidatus Limnocylindria bacterium]|nr:endolytic transglycosylase MltG [Candidatus Limnocylindria bacterium]
MGTQTRVRRGAPGDVRNGSYRPRRSEGGGGGRRLLVLLVVLAAVALAAVVTLPAIFGGLARSLAEDNPDWLRMPFIADAVRDDMAERLDQPGGTDDTPVEFIIPPGTSSRQITDDLVGRGLVTDRLAFSYILIIEGAGSRLQAGAHTLQRAMSPRQVAQALQAPPSAPTNRTTVALRDGLRIEQVTAYLLNESWPEFSEADFYNLAVQPPAELLADYPMLASLPDGRRLEGYLGFGVFEVERDIDAEGLLRVLLDRRQAEIGGLLDKSRPEPLEDFHQVMTLASIVEAEAALDEERPLVAGVYLNRLDPAQWPTRLLNADPTVVYGFDTNRLHRLPLEQWVDYVFWAPIGMPMAEVQLEGELTGFQTYSQRGIPPAPIRSPSLASIQGVLEPDTSAGYLYFVAKNDGTRTHAFATTFEEHMQNVERYVRGNQ